MYGLKEAAIIAFNQLVQKLARTATNQHLSLQVFGVIAPRKQRLSFVLMISASSTFPKPTLSI
jgi:hypothetical protein